MNDTKQLLAKYQPKGILVDTNILLLWTVGTANPERIQRFNRTEKFSIDDFQRLQSVLGRFTRRLTTPHILTEVYNFTNQLGSPDRERALAGLAAATQNLLEERWDLASKLTQSPKFKYFGLTDIGIEVAAADQELLVLTDDFKLCSHLWSVGVDVVNFNNLRFSIPKL